MGELLRATIESVWASTRLPDELILVDDGSVMATTREVIDALQRDAERRKLPLTVRRQGNAGLAAARNAGLAAARGDLISFLDGDDLIEPSFYDIAAAMLESNPELGGVAAWAVCFGEGVPDGFWNAPQPELPLLLVENPVIVPCMMRVETLRALGGYDVRQRYNYEDWELSLRLVAAGHPIVTIPRYLQRYRVRANSLLRTMTDVQNQTMRERMLGHHRQTVARFGVEAAMLVENQLAKRLYAPSPRSANHDESAASRRGVLADLRRTLTRSTGALVRAARR
jgi:glycosyltransferase involved in cell wall biosynthesis